ncbi:MAG: hypothetical protein ACR5LD_01230 [Symbiopectobacterium sp.]
MCKALREEDYRVILMNANLATIMIDLEMDDAAYIKPNYWEVVHKIIEKSVLMWCCRPWGQTALNCALELERQGHAGGVWRHHDRVRPLMLSIKRKIVTTSISS